MELIKINEAYTIQDDFDKLSTQGQVIKENNGTVNISFSVTDVETSDHNHIGSYNYNIPIEGQGVSANYNCKKEYEDVFIKYSENLIKEILQRLNTSVDI